MEKRSDREEVKAGSRNKCEDRKPCPYSNYGNQSVEHTHTHTEALQTLKWTLLLNSSTLHTAAKICMPTASGAQFRCEQYPGTKISKLHGHGGVKIKPTSDNYLGMISRVK